MTILLSLLVALAGLFMYFVSSNAKVAEVGRISFAMGLLVSLVVLGPKVATFLR